VQPAPAKSACRREPGAASTESQQGLGEAWSHSRWLASIGHGLVTSVVRGYVVIGDGMLRRQSKASRVTCCRCEDGRRQSPCSPAAPGPNGCDKAG
jgi:hypothetical protein